MPKNSLLFAVVLLLVLVLKVGAAAGSEELLPVPEPQPQAAALVELGKELFFDRRLSGDGTMSCATCHIPEQGFSDGAAISLNYPTTRNWRNAPTLINVAFSRYLFHDGRARSLEEQALFPILSAFEMNQNLDYLEEELRSVPEYVTTFRAVFGSEDTTRDRVAKALAAFQRTIISRNSALDRYLQGEAEALSQEAKKGLGVFMGKGRCAQCHYGINLIDDRFHALNVPENPNFQNDPRVAATRRFVAKLNGFEAFRTLSEDPGRYLISKQQQDWRAFKTPTLREINLTAPYMHNGIFSTLDEVINFFDRGGGDGNTVLVPLGLSVEEKEALKSFLVEGLRGKEISFTFPKVP